MLLPKQVIALGKIAAREHSRFSAVRVERHDGRPRALATDGQRAVIFAWDEPDAAEFPPVEGLSSKPVAGFATNVPPRTLADAARGIASRIHKPIFSYLLLDESNASVVQLAAATPNNVTRAQAKVDDDAGSRALKMSCPTLYATELSTTRASTANAASPTFASASMRTTGRDVGGRGGPGRR